MIFADKISIRTMNTSVRLVGRKLNVKGGNIMIQAALTSNKTGRVIKSSYTARQLLENFCGEDDLMVAMSECDCQPTGMLSFVECNCHEEWDDWTLVLEQHS